MHGGAWRSGSASEFTFLAEPFVRAGADFAVLDFINVDDAGVDLCPMVEQVRRAVGFIYRNAEKFGGDCDPLYLISHSSGSHPAGCVVTHDWASEGLPRDILKGATLSSGMYDLKPVRLSKRSKYVSFTDAAEHALSAMRLSTSSRLRSFSVTALTSLRNFSGRRATLPLRLRLPASRSSFWSAKLTTISKCWRRSQILTACSAVRCLGRWDWCDGENRVLQAAAASVFGIFRTEVRTSSAPQRPQA